MVPVLFTFYIQDVLKFKRKFRRQRVKAPDFLDIRHYEGGRLSTLRTGRLYPRRNLWYSFLEAESTPGHMVPSVGTEKSPVTPTGIDPETVGLVAQCLNHYATPGPRWEYIRRRNTNVITEIPPNISIKI